jgi:hypothetical protein
MTKKIYEYLTLEENMRLKSIAQELNAQLSLSSLMPREGEVLWSNDKTSIIYRGTDMTFTRGLQHKVTVIKKNPVEDEPPLHQDCEISYATERGMHTITYL